MQNKMFKINYLASLVITANNFLRWIYIMNKFENKIALVTGATRGIGQAIALELGKNGAMVVGVGSSSESVSSFDKFCVEQNIKGKGLVMDVSSLSSIEAGVSEIVKQIGVPSILVNNAGITRDNLLMRMSQEEWDKVIVTNLNSVFWLCKACIRDMLKARYGRIINVTSLVAFTGNPGQTNYTASKAGVVAFSKSLALEVGSRNITVNTVAPGFIGTDMTDKLSEEQRKVLLEKVPLGRVGLPVDVAKAVSFLASDDANYITGTTIHVNGGMYL